MQDMTNVAAVETTSLQSLAFSPNGRYFVFASSDGIVRIPD